MILRMVEAGEPKERQTTSGAGVIVEQAKL
jgi:hypothetical protein